MTFCRDTFVISISLGGVRALRELLARLPLDLQASVPTARHQSAECGGPLWGIGSGGTMACGQTGPSPWVRALLGSQADDPEHSIWTAVWALVERAATLAQLADSMQARNPRSVDGFRERAVESRKHADRASQFLVSLSIMMRPAADAAPKVCT